MEDPVVGTCPRKLTTLNLFCSSGAGREPELLPNLAGVHPRADGLHGGLVLHRLLGRARTHPRRQGPFTYDVSTYFHPPLFVKSRNLPFQLQHMIWCPAPLISTSADVLCDSPCPSQHPLRAGSNLHPGRPPPDGARGDDGQDEAGLPQSGQHHQRGE